MKPQPSASIYVLASITVVGLIALFLSAVSAFAQIMHWYQALFAALVIEAGMIAEAFAFMRGRNKVALVGLLVSLTVSLTYNYIQASQAANGKNISLVEVLALAIGPLSALTFLSLSLGKEWQMYDAELVRWESGQVDAQRIAADKLQAEIERRDAEERKQALRLEKLRLANSRDKSGDNSRENLSDVSQRDNQSDKSKKAWVVSYMAETGASQAKAYRDHKKKFGW